MNILVLYNTPMEEARAVLFEIPQQDWDPEFDEDREMLSRYIEDRAAMLPFFILTDVGHALPEIFNGMTGEALDLRKEQL